MVVQYDVIIGFFGSKPKRCYLGRRSTNMRHYHLLAKMRHYHLLTKMGHYRLLIKMRHYHLLMLRKCTCLRSPSKCLLSRVPHVPRSERFCASSRAHRSRNSARILGKHVKKCYSVHSKTHAQNTRFCACL